MQLQSVGVTKLYNGAKVIEGIDLHLKKEEIVSLLGVSGVGKSTLFNVLSGLSTPDEGNVFLQGADITGRPGHVSYMQQKDLLLPHKTILNNLTLPLILRGEKKKAARERVLSGLGEFSLEGTADKYPSQLSGGMRQRAALYRTYLFSDRVALLDEPFSALDPFTKREMHGWYLNVMAKIKLSTLFITHDIDEAILLSDRIYIMSGLPGRITAEFEIDAPRPRQLCFTTDAQFLSLKRAVLNALGLA